jgi:phytoene synthase
LTPDRFPPLSADEAAYLMAELRGENDWPLVLPYVPDAQRAGALALLCLMKELADAPARVSEVPLGQIRFQWWRDALDEAFGARARRHPLVLALERTLGEEPAMRAPLDALIDEAESVLFEEAPPKDAPGAASLVYRVYGKGAEALTIWLGGDQMAAGKAGRAAVAHALARAGREGPRQGAGRPRAADLAAAGVQGGEGVAGVIAEARQAAKGLPGTLVPAALPLSLAKGYAKGKPPGPLGKRTAYFTAMLTGRF